ncbi:hypothetical protein V6N13_052931 [Hibiscus sabdariffa]
MEAFGFSGGIWFCWNEFVQVEILLQHFQFLHCRVSCAKTGLSFLLTLVYASPSTTKRKLLWPHLHSLATSINCLWLLIGDFNVTFAASERKCGVGPSHASRAFHNFIFHNCPRDLGFHGPDFTWSRGATFASLDRFLCNSLWDDSFSESFVTHVFWMKSDHRPILLQMGNFRNAASSRQFWYFSGWFSHHDWMRLI